MQTKIITTVFTYLFLIGAISAQATLSLGQMVNVAGKQRMLTQRMAKAFVYKGMNVNAEQANKEIASAITSFEENLRNLKAGAQNDAIRNRVTRQEQVWERYKAQFVAEPTRADIQGVINNSGWALASCEELVQEIVTYSKQSGKTANDDISASAEDIALLIGQVGKMRMQLQRMTLYYGVYYWDLDASGLQQARLMSDALQATLLNITTSELNDLGVDDAISDVIREWQVIREMCSSKSNCIDFEKKNMPPIQMYEVTNKIVGKVDKVVQAYSNMLK
jgi:Type IV pili methyl-accepting chemotaxis transducer N-term